MLRLFPKPESCLNASFEGCACCSGCSFIIGTSLCYTVLCALGSLHVGLSLCSSQVTLSVLFYTEIVCKSLGFLSCSGALFPVIIIKGVVKMILVP